VVQGGPASGGGNTPDPGEITISGNVIDSANRVMQQSALGGIRIGYTKNIAITGNVIRRAYGNGIYLSDSEEDVVITGNVINNVVSAGGVQRGIHVHAGSSRVVIDGNNLSDISGGVGINIAAAGKILLGSSNSYNTVTTPVSGGSAAQFGNAQTVTSGTTVDLGGYDTIVFSHGSATTVTAFTNVIVNKIYTFTSTNGNTTIDRTNAYLDGGANKTLTADDVMLVMGIGSNKIRQAATMAANS
jgi:parallel beta-helix repeat protein